MQRFWRSSIRLWSRQPTLWLIATISLVLCLAGSIPGVGPVVGNVGVILASGAGAWAAYRRGIRDRVGQRWGWLTMSATHALAVVVQSLWMINLMNSASTPVAYPMWRVLAALAQFAFAGILLWLATHSLREFLKRFMDVVAIGAAISVVLWVVALGRSALWHALVVRLTPADGIEVEQRVILCWGVVTLAVAAISAIADRRQCTSQVRVAAWGVLCSCAGLVLLATQSNDRQFVNVGAVATLLAAQKLSLVWATSLRQRTVQKPDPLAPPIVSYVAYGALGVAAVVDLLARFQNPVFDPVSHGLLAFMTVMVILRSNLTMQQNVHLLRELADQEAVLSRQAFQDDLTGLDNRRRFCQQLEDLLSAARLRPNEAEFDHVHVAYLDLDGFKAVNDTFGHPVGDAVLQSVADRLRDQAGSAMSLARLSGDEFGLLFIDCDTVEDVLQDVVLAMVEPIAVDAVDKPIQLSTSAGLARWDRGSEAGWKQVMRQADTALYQAKNNGRNQVQICVETMGKQPFRGVPQQAKSDDSAHPNSGESVRRSNRQ